MNVFFNQIKNRIYKNTLYFTFFLHKILKTLFFQKEIHDQDPWLPCIQIFIKEVWVVGIKKHTKCRYKTNLQKFIKNFLKVTMTYVQIWGVLVYSFSKINICLEKMFG